MNGLIGELKKTNGEGEEGGAGAGAGGKLDGGIERIKGLKRKVSERAYSLGVLRMGLVVVVERCSKKGGEGVSSNADSSALRPSIRSLVAALRSSPFSFSSFGHETETGASIQGGRDGFDDGSRVRRVSRINADDEGARVELCFLRPFCRYSEKRLLRYIVDYLIRTGRHEEAKGLAKSRGIEVSWHERVRGRRRGSSHTFISLLVWWL